MSWKATTIVVPMDFSDGSARALDVARTRLADGGRIELIYVLEHLTALHPAQVFEDDDDAERLEKASDALHRIAERKGLTSFRVVTTTTVGNPAAEIATYADNRKADLVVVASHGRTGAVRVAIGSVAERIVRYCKCPVLVVKTHPES